MTENVPHRKYLYAGLAAVAVLALAAALLRPPGRKPAPAPDGTVPPPVPLAPELAEKYREEPTISVYIHATGKVRRMKMEDYLAGVLAGEMSADWPPEALAAQAVVARTVTLKFMEDKAGAARIHGTDACTSPAHMQAYNAGRITQDVRRAVAATRGQVIAYQGKLIYAVFSAWSGGQTAAPEESLEFLGRGEDLPYLKSVPDPWDAAVPQRYRDWSVLIPEADLQRAVGGSGPIDTVSIREKGPSGRAMRLQIGDKTISGAELRSRLGSNRLYSNLITAIKAEGNRIRFTGRGWGHGVGMSQWGAYGQAKAGRGYAAILRYYYPGSDVQKLWP